MQQFNKKSTTYMILFACFSGLPILILTERVLRRLIRFNVRAFVPYLFVDFLFLAAVIVLAFFLIKREMKRSEFLKANQTPDTFTNSKNIKKINPAFIVLPILLALLVSLYYGLLLYADINFLIYASNSERGIFLSPAFIFSIITFFLQALALIACSILLAVFSTIREVKFSKLDLKYKV